MKFCENIDVAAALIRQDGVLLYPTETFWGLGCLAFSEEGIARVYALKKRSLTMALPLIAGSFEQVEQVAVWTENARALALAFWPAPLSLLLSVRDTVPACLSAGTGHVAVRLSGHPVARALALRAGAPLVSTSANLSGETAVREYTALHPTLVSQVDMLVNLPPAPAGGLASSIVEVGTHSIRMVREGAVSRATLQAKGYECV